MSAKRVESPETAAFASTPPEVDSSVTVKGVVVAAIIGAVALVLCFVLMTLVSQEPSSVAATYFTSMWPATLFPMARNGVPPAPIMCVLLCFGINWVAWIPASILQTEKFYDLTGGLSYLSCVAAALGVAAHYGLPMTVWRVLPAVLVAVWALRLAGFLFYRIAKSPRGDKRFDAIKVNPASFFIPWTLQAVWASVTSIAMIVQVNSIHVGSALIPMGSAGSRGVSASNAALADFFDFASVAGLLLWFLGFGLEVVADAQKLQFSSDPRNKGRFIQGGVWSWCRHPNYFGEITLWTGMFVMGFRAYRDAQWLVVLSPLLVATLLLFVSGLPQLESAADERWGAEPEYQHYKDTVHVMIPFAAKLPCCGHNRTVTSGV